MLFIVQVKFHIISLHKLRGCSSQNTSPMHHLNMEQLAKTLTSLFNLYDANRHSNSTYKNEAEFCSFYVLLHLDSNSQPMVDLYSSMFIYFLSVLIAFLYEVLYIWIIACSGPRGSHFLGGLVMCLLHWSSQRKCIFPEGFYGIPLPFPLLG
jgi:hypothetical protein